MHKKQRTELNLLGSKVNNPTKHPLLDLHIGYSEEFGFIHVPLASQFQERYLKNGYVIAEYIAKEKHEAILGQRLNEGYEWTRQQLEKHENEIKEAKAKVWEEAAHRFMDFTVEEMSLPLAWIIDRRVDEFKAKAAEFRGSKG
jgi:hypothetical protein